MLEIERTEIQVEILTEMRNVEFSIFLRPPKVVDQSDFEDGLQTAVTKFSESELLKEHPISDPIFIKEKKKLINSLLTIAETPDQLLIITANHDGPVFG